MVPYKIVPPLTTPVPIIISIPHCGTAFPEEIKDQYNQHLIQSPTDTDWFVDTLYDFAPAMGITMITAVYSRWVIDLNRDFTNKPLYNDGRIITELCPTTTFLREPLYKDKRTIVAADETRRRLNTYYVPYHEKIRKLLDQLKSKFGNVLLWDCHSIRQIVSTIQEEKFTDLILGDNNGTSSSKRIIDIALKNLGNGSYTLSHNHPFKGGTITRYFGKPNEKQHALQLEMTKINYMNDDETTYNEPRANKMREVLKTTFQKLVDELLDGHNKLSLD